MRVHNPRNCGGPEAKLTTKISNNCQGNGQDNCQDNCQGRKFPRNAEMLNFTFILFFVSSPHRWPYSALQYQSYHLFFCQSHLLEIGDPTLSPFTAPENKERYFHIFRRLSYFLQLMITKTWVSVEWWVRRDPAQRGSSWVRATWKATFPVSTDELSWKSWKDSKI